MKCGDLVVAVGDEAVESLADFYRKVWARGAAGVEVPLRVLQGLQLKDIAVRSMDRTQHLRRKQAY
jgi:S1-C subfamily serine protease